MSTYRHFSTVRVAIRRLYRKITCSNRPNVKRPRCDFRLFSAAATGRIFLFVFRWISEQCGVSYIVISGGYFLNRDFVPIRSDVDLLKVTEIRRRAFWPTQRRRILFVSGGNEESYVKMYETLICRNKLDVCQISQSWFTAVIGSVFWRESKLSRYLSQDFRPKSRRITLISSLIAKNQRPKTLVSTTMYWLLLQILLVENYA